LIYRDVQEPGQILPVVVPGWKKEIVCGAMADKLKGDNFGSVASPSIGAFVSTGGSDGG